MSNNCTRAKAMRSMVSPPQEAGHNFMASNYTTSAAQQTEYRQSASESFYGYIQTITDAELLLAAYLAGCIRLASEMPIETSVRSGGVYIHRESGRKWMDGLNWSHPSSDRGFLVYRILEEVRPGELNFRRTNALRNRKLPNACFCKRVISLTGTDGKRYTITSYFETKDVMHLFKRSQHSNSRVQRQGGHLRTPSQLQEFAPFLKHAALIHQVHDYTPIMLPPSILPIVTPSPSSSRNEEFGDGSTISDSFDLTITPLLLPTSIMPTQQPKESFFHRLEALKQQRIQEQECWRVNREHEQKEAIAVTSLITLSKSLLQ